MSREPAHPFRVISMASRSCSSAGPFFTIDPISTEAESDILRSRLRSHFSATQSYTKRYTQQLQRDWLDITTPTCRILGSNCIIIGKDRDSLFKKKIN